MAAVYLRELLTAYRSQVRVDAPSLAYLPVAHPPPPRPGAEVTKCYTIAGLLKEAENLGGQNLNTAALHFTHLWMHRWHIYAFPSHQPHTRVPHVPTLRWDPSLSGHGFLPLPFSCSQSSSVWTTLEPPRTPRTSTIPLPPPTPTPPLLST
jgi:hypothetical protein